MVWGEETTVCETFVCRACGAGVLTLYSLSVSHMAYTALPV
jgi:hypothetical protein